MTNPLTCEHPNQEVRKFTTANGSIQYVKQCVDCGSKTSDPIAKAKVPEIWNVKPFDADFQKNATEEAFRIQRESAIADAEQERLIRDAEYNAYLKTDGWRDKSDRCLERDGYECKAELPGCLGRATQAHHLTYAHLFNEPLFDLIAVCKPCHESIHGKKFT